MPSFNDEISFNFQNENVCPWKYNYFVICNCFKNNVLEKLNRFATPPSANLTVSSRM